MASEPDGGARSAASPSPAGEPPGRSCAVDEVLESVCGQMAAPSGPQKYPFERCAPTGVALGRELARRTIDPSAGRRDRGELSSFTFDPDETHAAVIRQLGRAAAVAVANRATYTTTMCCYTRCTPLEVADAADPIPSGHDVVPTCVPAPQRTSMSAPKRASCPLALRIRGKAVRFASGSDGECCYATTLPSCQGGYRDEDGQCRQHNRGRPLREDGRTIAAATVGREGWSADAASIAETHRDAAVAWARNAAAEHASVAAFGRLSLDLLALGAPADLVHACHVAAIEEIEHARLSYGVASTLAGVELGPGPLALGTGPRRIDLVELARETFLDGCVAETAAALEADKARDLVEHEAIASALSVIARDEASHAVLAFRILGWALRAGGEPARRVVEELALEVERETREPRELRELRAGGALARLGILDEAAFAEVRARAVREVVSPCVRELLALAPTRPHVDPLPPFPS